MLQSKANWKYTSLHEAAVNWEDDSIELSPIVKQLLQQRGITNIEEARQFLSPDIKNLHSPVKIDSIERAAARVHKAIDDDEKILIYGDYDADGVSSTTVLMKALEELGADCDFYIPNRFTEGYGPNEAAFRAAAKNGFALIITVDTGIASVHEAQVASELGIDLIITDHHEPQEELPECFAIIHPKCSEAYPFQELAGVGVAFKFAQSLLGYFPKHLLEFAAIGTIADLVPLVDENRVLAFYGLHALTISQNPGIKALKRVCKIEGNVTEEDVGFMIGPRINAVGRLENADLAVQLLLTDDDEVAQEMAEEIDVINNQRKKIVNDIFQEAQQIVESSATHDVIIVAKEGWNEGVLGIVASKLVRKYDRPAIVLTVKHESNTVKGSARSIPAFDFFQNGMRIRELFTHFGGHSQAAGMTFPLENLQLVQEKLDTFIREELTEADFKQEIEISAKLTVETINEELVQEIARLAPFGMKNPKPIFELNEIPADARKIGSAKNHLKLLFKQDSQTLDSIGFGMGELYEHISPNTALSLAGELGINEWNGNRKAQFLIQDMKIDEWQLFDFRGKKNRNVHIDTSDALVVATSNQSVHPDVEQITYDTDVQTLDNKQTLYIYELPTNLNQLKAIINQTKPVNIYACYHIEDSAYLSAFPSREEFIWFYALVRKRRVLDLKTELQTIMNHKGWSKDRIIFISSVFFELGFVKIEDGVIEVETNPMKKDLTDSKLYQERLNKADIEKQLYYSNYEELKTWFEGCMDYLDTPEEEVVNGL
ncbi:single-stranded-DNA-specific exonuclease RecJ [Oceanobacillus polygoni]|uniref:Single-stranded-DNA-specific exonuclease RecJ n=1 Tax=Oceanobacillus polygoni TaxID=1235259 RepID=A0A9X1CGX7_9BACI|nr:single-stranded-DNA-specific exonuclease RecJ [Oceanobacillus polygoni]MBP2077472.1 single-stranded-DNA-specific exonuclease [Oceanobacillus polygoni]